MLECLESGQILAARRLPNGDLILTADSIANKIKIQEKANAWIQVIGHNAKVRPGKFSVWVHGVRVQSFDNAKQNEGLQKIYQQNPALGPETRLSGFHWRKKAL